MMNLAHKTICYSAPCRKAEYGDECVCLFVRMYISGTTRSSFTGVSMRVANGHGSVLLWRLCDMLCIRYDTRCYFNVRSKADISQLNLPHGTDN